LLDRRCRLWIYTTSYRPRRYLRRWFASFGVRLEGVVNQDVHERLLRRWDSPGYPPSKYPPAFGINLHVDDSEGVAMEGKQYRFNVLVRSPATPTGRGACSKPLTGGRPRRVAPACQGRKPSGGRARKKGSEPEA